MRGATKVEKMVGPLQQDLQDEGAIGEISSSVDHIYKIDRHAGRRNATNAEGGCTGPG